MCRCVCVRVLAVTCHIIAILVPMMLITGLTHESLDRFVDLLLAALAGHMTLPDMWRSVFAALSICLAMS